MPAPKVAHTAYRVDYGPRWRNGIIDLEPPKLGPAFVTLVPQVDAFGNELGGVRNAELRVPLGTYASWNLRAGLANPGELNDFFGTFVPFRRAELYADPMGYARRLVEVADEIVMEGFMLPEDVKRVVTRNTALFDWIVAVPRD